jgi:23S rRNA (cytosine1962-C5)-methyltransferase
VLDLFAYTGMLGRAIEAAGAAHVTHVDASERALAFAAAHHVSDPTRHAFITADIFDWLPALDPGAQFELVIVDPPSMTSSKAQVPAALAAYRRLYRAAARHVVPGGAIVAACCTSRIERAVFHRTVRETLGSEFTQERELATEIDHPIGFPQADYLKIAFWRRATAA